MEQNTPKFRLKLKLFYGIVILLALVAGGLMLWTALKPQAPAPAGSTASSDVRYTIRFRRWAPGSSGAVKAGDKIADNIKNYEVGQVVSVQAVPALAQVPDQNSRRWVWAELEGFEDVLVTVESPCVISDDAITIGGGYQVRVGTVGYFRGEGYMGSGPIVAIEEVTQ